MSKTNRSFRDPSGYLVRDADTITRHIYPQGKEFYKSLLRQSILKELIAKDMLIETWELDHSLSPTTDLILGHELITFPSYAYEWSPRMLAAAAECTLDIAESMLSKGISIKDATPYNILFRGAQPIFVDFLSFEKRNEKDPVWIANAQFTRTFLLPLLGTKERRIQLSKLFLSNREGIESEELYAMSGLLSSLKPPFLNLVTIPALLSKWINRKKNTSPTLYKPHLASSPEKAQFILEITFKRLRKQLKKINSSKVEDVHLSQYMLTEKSYTDQEFQDKHTLVSHALDSTQPDNVLDIGCNKGHFSFLAASKGASVVAIDVDEASIDNLWSAAHHKKLDILPLVIDICRPSPSTGWNNAENLSFLERAKGHFDMVFMLAMLHHIVVTERVPLPEIVDLTSELTTDHLIIEYVSPEDPMFRRIARGREHLHFGFTRESFENAFSSKFKIVNSHQVGHSLRWVYHMKKHGENR